MANLPPNRDEFSEDLEYQLAYDQWAYEITQDVNSGEVGGGGTVTSEVDDQGQTVLGGVPQGYQLRYLDTAYATSADGANISPAISALPADRTQTYQLVRNIDNEVESLNPADFSARLVSSTPSAAQRAYYRLRTGGQVPNWVFAEERPVGFVEDLGTSVIDLDAVTSTLFEVNSIDEYNQAVAIANIGDRLYTVNDLTDPSASETQTYTFETPTDFLFSGFPYASLSSAAAGVSAIQAGTSTWFTQLDNGNVITTSGGTNGAAVAAFVFSTTTQNDPTILALSGETGFEINIGGSVNTFTVDSVEELGAGGTANFVYRLNLTNTDSNSIPNYNISSGASFQANVASTVERTFTSGDLRNPIPGAQGFITFSDDGGFQDASQFGAGDGTDASTTGPITRVNFTESSADWVGYTGETFTTFTNNNQSGLATGVFDEDGVELIFAAAGGGDLVNWFRGDFRGISNEAVFFNADTFEGPSIDAGFYTFDGLFFLPDGGDSTVTNTITTVEGNNVRLDIAYFDDAAGTNPAYPLGLTSSTTYFPAVRDDRNFQGTNVVFWIDVEPAVSQDPADYEIAQLTGDDGAQGSSVEIFFAYANTDDGLNEADDANDVSFSTTYFMDALYIGTDAVSHEVGVDPVRSTDATTYEWARLRGEDGMSITGPGGSSNRIDFAYFFAADGSLEMDQTNAFPSGTMQDDDYVAAVRGEREFLGTNVVTWIAGETEPDPSTTISDYEILPVIGERGDDGLSTQLYFAYADTDDGLNEADTLNDASFSTTYFTDALYVGTDAVTYPAGTIVPIQSTDATTYEWSRLRGEDGLSITGPGGSANRIDVAYFDAADGTDPVYPTGTLADDDYVLATRGTRQFQGTNVVTWIAGETEPEVSTTATDYEITRIVADDGEDGLSTQLYFAYANTDDGLNEANDANDTSFATTYFADALYVGTDAVTYTAGTAVPTQSTDATTYEWSRLRGEDGITGPGGSANRIDIAYFADAAGTDPVYPTGTLAGDDYVLADRGTRQFQGTNVVTWVGGETEPAVSTTVADYEITRIVADDGDNGLSTQLYFAYANTDDGLNEADDANDTSFATTYFEDALYVGTDAVTYTAGTTIPDQSTDATTYEWSRLRGEDGVTGPGGSANRIDIAYFAAADGTDPVYPSGTLAGDDYVTATRGTRNFQGTNVVTWIAGETEPAVSTTVADYEIVQINGESGLSTQLYFAYANSADGVTDFSTSYFDDALFVGTDAITYLAGTTTPTQSTTNTDYEWSRLRGEDGTNGTSVLVIYASDAMGSDRSLTPGQGLDFVLYHEYVGTAPDIADVTGTWVSFVGADGILGQSVFPIYAEDANGSNPSLTPTSTTTFVTFYESQEAPILGTTDLSGQTWVEYVGRGADLFIRLHENVITNDPGAPTGADGLGGGWYDPDGTVPIDPNPHWEARGTGEITAGRPVVYNFDLEGLGGGLSTSEVASFQDHDFVFSGSIGEETLITPARPTITDFDFGGQAAEFTPFDGGRPEIWRVDVTGTSDAAGGARSEEFFIYLDGNSAPTGGTVTYNARFFEPNENSPAASVPTLNAGSTPTNQRFFTLQQGGSDVGFSTIDPSGGLVTWRYAFREQGSSVGETQDASWRGFDTSNSNNKLLFSPSATNFMEYDSATQTWGFSSSQTVWEVTPVSVSIVNAFLGNNIDRLVTVTFNPSDLVTLQTDPDDTPVAVGDRVQYALVEAVDSVTRSTVQVSIPTESLDQTFTLTSGLTTATALRDNLLTSLQASTAFTDEFTITSDVASGIADVTDGEPIVKLVANDNTDHSIGVTFTAGDGDLTGSSFGSLVEGSDVETISTAVRVTYDSNLTPSFQDIVFGDEPTTAALATTLAAMIDGHGELSATASISDSGDDIFGLGYAINGGLLSTLQIGPSNIFADNFDEVVGITFTDSSGFDAVYDNSDEFIALIAANTYIHQIPSSGAVSSFRITGSAFVQLLSSGQARLYVPVTPEIEGTFDSFFFASQGDGIFLSNDRIPVFVDDVLITTIPNGVFETNPTFVITAQGTTDDVPTFTVTNPQDGIADVPQDGTPTSYEIIVDGTEVITGDFVSAASATDAALAIQGVIDGLATHSAVVDGTDNTIISATSAANGPDVIEVVIVQGTNSSTATSTNNLLTTRTISQTGVLEDVIVGEDAMLTLTVEDVVYETHNVSGMTLSEIATLVATRFNAHPDAPLTATALANEVSVINGVVGVENTPGVTVVSGVLSTGDAATFAVNTVVNNNGVTTTITGGQLSSYSITIDGVEQTSGDFSDSVSAIAAVGELITALTNVAEYSGSADLTDPSILVATAAIDGEVAPVIDLTITAGLFIDDTAATLSETRTLFQTGIDETVSFVNTEWSYFVINQEIRVDDDTITMMDNNSLAVNRGLILDTQVWDDISNVAGPNVGNAADLEIAYLTESFTTQGRPSLAVVTLTTLTSGIVSFGAAAEDTLGYQLEFSVDNGQTWTLAVSSFAFRIAHTFSGTNYQSVLPVNFSSVFTLMPETTYWLRVIRVIRRSGAVITNPTTNINSNFLVNLLAIEELLA